MTSHYKVNEVHQKKKDQKETECHVVVQCYNIIRWEDLPMGEPYILGFDIDIGIGIDLKMIEQMNT